MIKPNISKHATYTTALIIAIAIFSTTTLFLAYYSIRIAILSVNDNDGVGYVWPYLFSFRIEEPTIFKSSIYLALGICSGLVTDRCFKSLRYEKKNSALKLGLPTGASIEERQRQKWLNLNNKCGQLLCLFMFSILAGISFLIAGCYGLFFFFYDHYYVAGEAPYLSLMDRMVPCLFLVAAPTLFGIVNIYGCRAVTKNDI